MTDRGNAVIVVTANYIGIWWVALLCSHTADHNTFPESASPLTP